MTLSFQDHRQHVNDIIQAAITAVDPAAAVARQLHVQDRKLTIHNQTIEQHFNLSKGRVFLISIGKAAVPMGTAVAEKLGDDLTFSLFVAKKSERDWELAFADTIYEQQPSPFVLIQAGHPVPDGESLRAGTAVFNLLSQTTADDLVIFCISGGASALITKPRIPMDDWQTITTALLGSGCSINAFNSVRRQLDDVKGGGLAAAAAPASCISLILSDVVGNDLAAIGSGPTVFTQNKSRKALDVMATYKDKMAVEPSLYDSICHAIQTVPTLQKPPTLHNIIIADGRRAALAAFTKAAQLGFLSQILTTNLEGEAREVGKVVAAIAKDLPEGNCLILGGETAVTLQGDGIGGRNQELALAAGIAIEGWQAVVIAAFATDGEDGPTTAAGAMVTGTMVSSSGQNPHVYLQNNNSHPYLQAINALINIGPTGTNVNDLILILSYPVDTDISINLSTEEE